MGTSLTWITDAVAGPAPIVDPNSPALALDDGAPLSWLELRDKELRYASALRRAGVGKGDRVGILLRNSTDYVVLYLAIARLGAIGVRLNWRLTPSELSYIVGDADATVLVFDGEYADRVNAFRAEAPIETFVAHTPAAEPLDWAMSWDEFLTGELATDCPSLEMGDPVSLIYTSGTTGRPKGVVWTHGTTLWFCSMQAMRWKYDTHTVAMTPGPLFHVGGLEAVLLPALVSHGTAVTFSSGGFDLERLLDVVRSRSVTTLLLYAFMVYDLVRLPGVDKLVPGTLARVMSGGDTLQPWAYPEFGKVLPGIELVQVYGSSESGAVSTCLDWEFAQDHPGGVGRPMPMAQISLVNADGAVVGSDEVGEILVRGPSTASEYWRNPAATAETFVDGWCHTGDLGRLDEQGFLYLTGRAKDMIRSGGENVYPAEVEAVLAEAANVADAAVFGVADPRFTEVGCAALVALPGTTIDLDEVREYCRTRLAKFKVPRYLVVVDELPRTASGKVKKYELRQLYDPAAAAELS